MKPTTPTIIIDSREKTPLVFDCPSVVRGLYSGDYSFVGAEHLFAVERKSLDDLAASCTFERREVFEHELLRLRGCRFKRLLIIGSEEDVCEHRYHSEITPKAVLGSLRSFEVRYDVPVVWKADPDSAARQVELWAQKFATELCKVSYNVSQAKRATSSHSNPRSKVTVNPKAIF
jgi:ERCC4-type nuclease